MKDKIEMIDEPFQIPGYITSMKSLKAGGWKIEIETQEIDAELIGHFAKLKDKYGWFLFLAKETGINWDMLKDLPALDDPDDKKTISQRIRDHMYVLHLKQKKNKSDFSLRYKQWGEKIIQNLKEQIMEFE